MQIKANQIYKDPSQQLWIVYTYDCYGIYMENSKGYHAGITRRELSQYTLIEEALPSLLHARKRLKELTDATNTLS